MNNSITFLSLLILIILIFGCTVQTDNTDNKGSIQIEEQKVIEPESIAKDDVLYNPAEEITPTEQNDVQPAERIPSTRQKMISGPGQLNRDLSAKEVVSPWSYGGKAILGKYADAEFIDLGNGKYRMYYSAEPEVSGFKGQLYSATSSDGLTWTAEKGERMEWAIFPSVIKLSNDKYRMYYQKGGEIKSAISSDGLSWKEESGTRIDKTNSLGLVLDNVAAPTIIKVDDEYMMVYRGTINEKYPEMVPNSNTQLFFWATSNDGLSFEKKGMALDSRTDKFKGLLDGPELVRWDDGKIRLYFWTYTGIYHVIFDNGKFSGAEFDYSINRDPMKLFAENPPCDPTLGKVNGKWYLYYGIHTQGIEYAVLR